MTLLSNTSISKIFRIHARHDNQVLNANPENGFQQSDEFETAGHAPGRTCECLQLSYDTHIFLSEIIDKKPSYYIVYF